jgi:hypothetical protein
MLDEFMPLLEIARREFSDILLHIFGEWKGLKERRRPSIQRVG